MSRNFIWFVTLLFALITASHAGPAVSPTLVRQQLNELAEQGIGLDLSSYFFVGPSCGLLFVGTQHNFDPTSKLFPLLDKQFAIFEPTELIVEGGTWPELNGPTATVRLQGEMGYLSGAARRAGISASSFEPDEHSLVHMLSKDQPLEEIEIYLALRMVPQLRAADTPQALPKLMQRFLDHQAPVGTAPHTVDQLDAFVRRDYGSAADWQSLDTSLRINGKVGASVFAVDKAANRIRNAALLDAIAAALKPGHRVMVAAGVTHLAALLPNLNELGSLCPRQ